MKGFAKELADLLDKHEVSIFSEEFEKNGKTYSRIGFIQTFPAVDRVTVNTGRCHLTGYEIRRMFLSDKSAKEPS